MTEICRKRFYGFLSGYNISVNIRVILVHCLLLKIPVNIKANALRVGFLLSLNSFHEELGM